MDCDLSMPPEDIPHLVRAIAEGGADVAVGSRWIPGGADVAHGVMARTLSRIINGLAMALVGGEVHDYTSGFIAGRAAVFRTIRLRGDYGEYCIDLLGRAVRAGYTVREVPYRVRAAHGRREQDRRQPARTTWSRGANMWRRSARWRWRSERANSGASGGSRVESDWPCCRRMSYRRIAWLDCMPTSVPVACGHHRTVSR